MSVSPPRLTRFVVREQGADDGGARVAVLDERGIEAGCSWSDQVRETVSYVHVRTYIMGMKPGISSPGPWGKIRGPALLFQLYHHVIACDKGVSRSDACCLVGAKGKEKTDRAGCQQFANGAGVLLLHRISDPQLPEEDEVRQLPPRSRNSPGTNLGRPRPATRSYGHIRRRSLRDQREGPNKEEDASNH